MRLKKKKSASKPSKFPTTTAVSDCYVCGKKIDWRYEGLINGAGRELCSHECFNSQMVAASRMVGSIDFDDL